MINVKNIQHHFSKDRPLFNSLSLCVAKNERVLLTGVNGSGKTTLLKILSGQLLPSQGTVTIEEAPPQKLSIRNKLVYIPPHNEGLLPRLTIRENLHFLGNLMNISEETRNTHKLHWSSIPSFAQSLDTPFFQCSTGMKKMAIIAALTLHQPLYIFADELFENIDLKSEELIIEVLNQYFKQATFIISSHRKTNDQFTFTKRWEIERGVLHAR